MIKYRNKFVTIHRVLDAVEKNQYLVGQRSFVVHDSDLSRWLTNNRSPKVNSFAVAVGLNRTRKPRTEVC